MHNTIYVVAGGPSLTGYDWSKLRDKRVIAVNRSYEVLPYAEIVYFSDKRFFHWHEKGLIAHSAVKVTGAKLEHPEVDNVSFSGRGGLSTVPGVLRSGNCSGYAAINLAIQMGATSIVLLGFDMKFSAGDSHWHDGHPIPNKERQFKKMLPFFETMLRTSRALNVSIINACPESAITCFQKIQLEQAHNYTGVKHGE